MSIGDWILKTIWPSLWLKRVVVATSKKLEGRWVAVSLDDENDRNLLELAGRSGAYHECLVKFQLSGFTDQQQQHLGTAQSKIKEICRACEEHYDSAKLSWNETMHTLAMDVTSTIAEPEPWFYQTGDVIPQFLGQQLEFDLNNVAIAVKCHLRST